MFFHKMQYFQLKCPWHVPFIIHSHLKISYILPLIIKLENNYVIDE